ncbi:nucleotidyl transferase AbiEii/AbiGii toxin family protein [Candidatus Woesearchaeota archaeon]|nr:nucleotidyl transferase AbiEii/AbiGii toxin family protein [Candidatus Woesearchaeota archaeon]
MINKKELQDFARIKGLNLGNAEKDYLIDLALWSISKNTKKELVFKGGTCLYKFYKLDRFSEDIDFSAVEHIDVNLLVNFLIVDFGRLGIKAAIYTKKELHNSILVTLRIEGPLYAGKPMTYANIGIDINMKSQVSLEPEFLSYKSIYPEITEVSSLCMKKEEIFAEKIRAILTRRRARDLFDLYFLIENNVLCDKELIGKKMKYYNEKFDLFKLILNLKSLENKWERELKGFTTILPQFKIVEKKVSQELTEKYK